MTTTSDAAIYTVQISAECFLHIQDVFQPQYAQREADSRLTLVV